MSTNNSDTRYFNNPYTDYSTQTQEQIVNADYWRQYAKELAFSCMNKLKANADHSDGTLYTGNLGLIFMCFRLLNSNRFKTHENEIRNYMIDCLNANEQHFFKSGRKEARDASFLLGKGGLCVMGCLAAKVTGSETHMLKYMKEYASLASICEPVGFLRKGYFIIVNKRINLSLV